jgi:ATP-dependent helicase HepA
VDHSGNDVTDLYPADVLDQQLVPGQIDALIQNENFTEKILPSMISAATKIAERLGAAEISHGLEKMSLTLKHEIDRLKSLQKKNNNIRPEEIRIAVEEQATLAALIRDARIRLDALQLIRLV